MIKIRDISFEFDEGPWQVDVRKNERDGSHRIHVETNTDFPVYPICRLTPVIEGSSARFAEEDMFRTKERLANARLIAAAPEMLALLLEEVGATAECGWDRKVWELVDKIQPNKMTAGRMVDKTKFMQEASKCTNTGQRYRDGLMGTRSK